MLITLLAPNLASANDIYCKVVGITDGDTIKCLTNDKKQIKVRLYQIDAPESKQTFGSESKKALSDMIFNTSVIIENHGLDRYKHTLGTIYQPFCVYNKEKDDCFGRKDINLEMINRGMVWYYPFGKKSEQYKQAEARARNNKIALWADKNPLAPWDFRE